MLFDGFALRDMWRSGANARQILKDALANGDARWLQADSDVAYLDPDLEVYLKGLRGRARRETEAHHDKVADIMDDQDLSYDEVENFQSDYLAVATAEHTGDTLVTSRETRSGKKRLRIAAKCDADAACWKDIFDLN